MKLCLIFKQLNFAMQGQRLSTHEIYQYLTSKNFNLSSDRILRQQHPAFDTIWNILVFLCDQIKDQNFSQLEPMLGHILDRQIHSTSLKRMSEYINVSSTLKKLGYPSFYPFRQLFKPDREKVHQKLGRLVQACKFHEKALKNYDSQISSIKLLKNSAKEEKIKLQEIQYEVETVQKVKADEKPLYEEKKKIIEELNQEISYKRKQKIDLMNSQQELQNQLKKNKTNLEQFQLQSQEKEHKIRNLEKSIIQNGPALKKQCLTMIEKFEEKKQKIQQEENKQNKKFTLLEEALKVNENLKKRSQINEIEEELKKRKEVEKLITQQKKEKQYKIKYKQELLVQQKQLKEKILSNDRMKKEFASEIADKTSKDENLSGKVTKKKQEIHKMQMAIRSKEDIIQKQKDYLRKMEERKRNLIQKAFDKLNQSKRRFEMMKSEAETLTEKCFEGFDQY